MPTAALVLVVFAALAHAAWNVLAKTASGGATFVWLFSATAVAIWLPAGGRRGARRARARSALEGIVFMVGSGALHALYFVLLQRGYRDGDLSLVYPLARGTGPLLSTRAAIVMFSERPSALALAGGAIIVVAVFSLAGAGSGRRRRTAARGSTRPTGGARSGSPCSRASRSRRTRCGTSRRSARSACSPSSTTGARTSPRPRC